MAEDEYLDMEKPIELASLQGVVINGKPHFHMVLSDVDAAYTGHLEEGSVVLYRAEILLAEINGIHLKRIKNEVGTEIYAEA